MRKLVLTRGFLAAALLAGPMGAIAATTCPSGGFDQYLSSQFTCSTNNAINNEVFSQFSFVGSGTGAAPAPTAAGNHVSILDGVPGGSGFVFNPGMLAMSGQSQQETISFEVTGTTGPNGFPFLNFAETHLTGSGDILQTMTLSANGKTWKVSSPGVISLFLPGFFGGPVTNLFFTDTLAVDGGSSISELTAQFNQPPRPVPEPATLALFALGLAAIGFMRRSITN